MGYEDDSDSLLPSPRLNRVGVETIDRDDDEYPSKSLSRVDTNDINLFNSITLEDDNHDHPILTTPRSFTMEHSSHHYQLDDALQQDTVRAVHGGGGQADAKSPRSHTGDENIDTSNHFPDSPSPRYLDDHGYDHRPASRNNRQRARYDYLEPDQEQSPCLDFGMGNLNPDEEDAMILTNESTSSLDEIMSCIKKGTDSDDYRNKNRYSTKPGFVDDLSLLPFFSGAGGICNMVTQPPPNDEDNDRKHFHKPNGTFSSSLDLYPNCTKKTLNRATQSHQTNCNLKTETKSPTSTTKPKSKQNNVPRTPTLSNNRIGRAMDPVKVKIEGRRPSWTERSYGKRDATDPIEDIPVNSADAAFSPDEITFLGTLLCEGSHNADQHSRLQKEDVTDDLHGDRSEQSMGDENAPRSPSLSLSGISSDDCSKSNGSGSPNLKSNRTNSKSSSRRKTKSTKKTKRPTWTPEEDQRLKEEVEQRSNKRYYGMWKEIAIKIGGQHTHKECHDRYTKNLDPNLNKGRWTKEEDEHLRHLLSLPEMCGCNGEYKWPAIARKLKRCPKQVREHFQNSVDPHLTKRRQPWTFVQVEQLRTLMNEMEHQGLGRRWKEIASNFPGRSVDAVRAKGLSLLDSSGNILLENACDRDPQISATTKCKPSAKWRSASSPTSSSEGFLLPDPSPELGLPPLSSSSNQRTMKNDATLQLGLGNQYYYDTEIIFSPKNENNKRPRSSASEKATQRYHGRRHSMSEPTPHISPFSFQTSSSSMSNENGKLIHNRSINHTENGKSFHV